MTLARELDGIRLQAQNYLHDPLFVRFDHRRMLTVNQMVSAVGLVTFGNIFEEYRHVQAFCVRFVF